MEMFNWGFFYRLKIVRKSYRSGNLFSLHFFVVSEEVFDALVG
jgi:hypothetical protein